MPNVTPIELNVHWHLSKFMETIEVKGRRTSMRYYLSKMNKTVQDKCCTKLVVEEALLSIGVRWNLHHNLRKYLSVYLWYSFVLKRIVWWVRLCVCSYYVYLYDYMEMTIVSALLFGQLHVVHTKLSLLIWRYLLGVLSCDGIFISVKVVFCWHLSSNDHEAKVTSVRWWSEASWWSEITQPCITAVKSDCDRLLSGPSNELVVRILWWTDQLFQ